MAINLPPDLQKAAFDSSDRISNLPKEVIDEILKRMPISDAINTSMLSKSWRYKWMSMPDLVFDTRSIPSTINGRKRKSADLVSFVSNVLFLHNGNISKFEINNLIECGCSVVDQWILVLSRTTLIHLVLVFNLSTSLYPVPSCLFMCENLRELELEGCSLLKLPLQYKEFRCLTHLTLRSVHLTSETIEKLVTLSPLLRSVTVYDCSSLTHCNIYAPNLSNFKFRGCCERIKFLHTPNLTTLGIYTSLPQIFTTCRLDEVLGGLARIESLILVYPFMELSQEGLQVTYNRLKRVDLLLNFEDSKQIFAVLCLFRSSPYITKLTLQARFAGELDPKHALLYEENFWEGRRCKEAETLNHLKAVSLSGFKGVQHELDFVQFILLNAVVLETFTIKWDRSVQMDQQLLPIFEKMMQFKRASCEAKVVFSSLT